MADTLAETTGGDIQLTRLGDVVARHDPAGPWSEVIISDGRNRVILISGPPGTPPDPHIHPDYNEWWISVGGTTQWQVGQYEPLRATYGDIVIAPAGYSHDIRPKGAEAALRLAVSHPNSNHDIRGVAPSRQVPIDYSLPLPNLVHCRLDRITALHGLDTAWSEVAVRDTRNVGTFIKDTPGGTSPERRPTGDEWSIMLSGTAEVVTGGSPVVGLEAGDIVLVESATPYQVRTTGNSPALRVMVSPPN